MIPIRDDNPQINKPIAVYIIIALNIAAWLFIQGMGGTQLNESICHYGLIPHDLFSDGFNQFNSSGHCNNGAGWLGVFTSMFMHGSWMHIIGNMWFLYVFGDNIEDAMGSIRFIIFYILSGIAAAVAQVTIDPDSLIPMVGASGAIGGVMGAYIMLFPRVKVHMLMFIFIIRVPAYAVLGYWIVLQFLGSLNDNAGGGVAFAAHIGGFIAGAILIWTFKDDELLVNHPYHGWKQVKKPTDIWQDPKNRQ